MAGVAGEDLLYELLIDVIEFEGNVGVVVGGVSVLVCVRCAIYFGRSVVGISPQIVLRWLLLDSRRIHDTGWVEGCASLWWRCAERVVLVSTP